MKAEMIFSISTHRQVIDLEDYGHESDVSWNELNEEEKNEIRDSLTEQMIIECVGRDYDN